MKPFRSHCEVVTARCRSLVDRCSSAKAPFCARVPRAGEPSTTQETRRPSGDATNMFAPFRTRRLPFGKPPPRRPAVANLFVEESAGIQRALAPSKVKRPNGEQSSPPCHLVGVGGHKCGNNKNDSLVVGPQTKKRRSGDRCLLCPILDVVRFFTRRPYLSFSFRAHRGFAAFDLFCAVLVSLGGCLDLSVLRVHVFWDGCGWCFGTPAWLFAPSARAPH